MKLCIFSAKPYMVMILFGAVVTNQILSSTRYIILVHLQFEVHAVWTSFAKLDLLCEI